jgi:hypothetical protein
MLRCVLSGDGQTRAKHATCVTCTPTHNVCNVYTSGRDTAETQLQPRATASKENHVPIHLLEPQLGNGLACLLLALALFATTTASTLLLIICVVAGRGCRCGHMRIKKGFTGPPTSAARLQQLLVLQPQPCQCSARFRGSECAKEAETKLTHRGSLLQRRRAILIDLLDLRLLVLGGRHFAEHCCGCGAEEESLTTTTRGGGTQRIGVNPTEAVEALEQGSEKKGPTLTRVVQALDAGKVALSFHASPANFGRSKSVRSGAAALCWRLGKTRSHLHTQTHTPLRPRQSCPS